MSDQSRSRKHIPMRMCAVCRNKLPKRTLTRVVASSEGLQLDPTGKMAGRGAYLCENRQCWERAVKTDILSKALHTALNADDRLRLQQATPQP